MFVHTQVTVEEEDYGKQINGDEALIIYHFCVSLTRTLTQVSKLNKEGTCLCFSIFLRQLNSALLTTTTTNTTTLM